MPHSNKQMISFFLETRCNLRCIYCYNSEERAERNRLHEENTLNLEIAKAGIDEFFKDNCGIFNIKLDNPSCRHIRFYGPGEATIDLTGMQNITNYALKKGKELGYSITTELQTNGAFNKNVRKWILQNIDLLWISFDGLPNIHDKQRPMAVDNDSLKTMPSSERIEENIHWLIKNKYRRNRNHEFMLGLRSTITNESVEHQKDIIDYFKKMGVSYIWSDPEFPTVGKNATCYELANKSKYNFDLITYVQNYIEAYRYAKSRNIFYGSFLACNFDGRTEINCRACLPVPHITPDGYISACDLVVCGENNPKHMNCFLYGKWDGERFDLESYKDNLEKIKARNVFKLENCKGCVARYHCSGYCPGEVVNETGSLYGQLNGENNTRNVCLAIKLLYSTLFNEMTEDLKTQFYGKLVIKEGEEKYEYKYPHP